MCCSILDLFSSMTSGHVYVFVCRPCTIHQKEGPNILGHYASTLRLALATNFKGRVLLSLGVHSDLVAGSCVRVPFSRVSMLSVPILPLRSFL
jgi:hypothetical protein